MEKTVFKGILSDSLNIDFKYFSNTYTYSETVKVKI